MLVTLLPTRNVGAEDVSTTTSTDALITHYTMANTGNKLTDVSGNGHDATLVYGGRWFHGTVIYRK